MCKSEGVKDKLPPNSYIVLSPLADKKRCESGALICLLRPQSYTILPPLEAQCSQKRRKSFELHFPKNSSHCSPTLTSFWAEEFNPGPPVTNSVLLYSTLLCKKIARASGGLKKFMLTKLGGGGGGSKRNRSHFSRYFQAKYTNEKHVVYWNIDTGL